MTYTAQLWFGPAERPLFGWVSAPDDLRCRAGVVLCLPIGEEVRTTHRAMRKLAAALADAGFASIGFDYDGTGDSAGGIDDPGRPAAWVASVAAAAGVLRRMGLPTVSAVGLRMGATILTNCPPDLELDSVVLWDPCVTGRHFVREQQALHRTGVIVPPPRDDDRVELPEYLLSPQTAADLSAMQFVPEGSGRPPGRRALALTRPERPVPSRVREWLAAGEADLGPAPEQTTMLGDANGGYVPASTIGHIVGWLAGASPSSKHQATPAPVETVVTLPVETSTASSAATPTAVRETITSAGPLGLFAIVSEPADRPADSGTVVLIAASTEHHIGPARQWVELSRRWAARGTRVVRFDLSGVGFSPTRPDQDEHQQYAREWLDDVPEVVADLAAGPGPVTLAGLCSGAYGALESGLELRVDAVCAINPILTSSAFHSRSTMTGPRRRVVRRVPFLVSWAARHQPAAVWALWHAFTQLVPSRAPMAGVAAVARAGVDTLVVNSALDAEPFRRCRYWRYLGEPRLRRRTKYRMVVVPDADHALRIAAAREQTVRAVDEFVATRHRIGAAAEAPVGAQ